MWINIGKVPDGSTVHDSSRRIDAIHDLELDSGI